MSSLPADLVGVSSSSSSSSSSRRDDDPDPSSSSSSVPDDGTERGRPRTFAREINAEPTVDPTERNPGVARRNAPSDIAAAERTSVFRRPSPVGSDDDGLENHAVTATPLSDRGKSTIPKKSSLNKSRRLSLRNTLRKSVRKVTGQKSVRFVPDKHGTFVVHNSRIGRHKEECSEIGRGLGESNQSVYGYDDKPSRRLARFGKSRRRRDLSGLQGPSGYH